MQTRNIIRFISLYYILKIKQAGDYKRFASQATSALIEEKGSCWGSHGMYHDHESLVG